MELKIKRKVEQEETINIDFPYYYKHDLLLDEVDVVIYGMVEEHRSVSITIRDHDMIPQVELEIKKRPASTMSCYMTDEFKGTEKEFINAKELMLKSIREI